MPGESDAAFEKEWYGPWGNFDRGKAEAKKFWDAGIEWARNNVESKERPNTGQGDKKRNG